MMEYYDVSNIDANYDSLVSRANTYNKVRLYLIMALTVAGVALMFYSHASASLFIPLLALFGFTVATQLIFTWLIAFSRRHTLRRGFVNGVILFELISDVIIYSGAVFISGGSESQALVLYLLPIIIAGSLFNRSVAFFTTAITVILYMATIVAAQAHMYGDLPSAIQIGQAVFYCAVFFVFAYLADHLYALRQKREADLAQLEMVSLASHQLRTPATAVKGFLSLVLAGELGPLKLKQRDFLRRAYDENELELRLIDNILNVARIELKNLRAHIEDVDLTQLIEEVMGEHMQNIIDRDQAVEFKTSYPEKHIVIQADYQLIRMVIDNLISNASKYTPKKGKIIIILKRHKDTVELSVEDNGTGIARQDQKKLFRRFSRAINTNVDSTEGSGLGLYIMKEIIKLHNGKISLTSYKGVGSIFTVTLPRRSNG
jgi:signal transduction histidine kinase